MIYPGYLLNPGDMFQVEPDMVMFATGAPKDVTEAAASRKRRRQLKAKSKAVEGTSEESEEGASKDTSPSSSTSNDLQEGADEATRRITIRANFKTILNSAKEIMNNKKDAPRAKQKQALRALSANVRKAIGGVNRSSIDALVDDLNRLLSQMRIAAAPPSPKSPDSGNSSNQAHKMNAPPPTPRGMISQEDRLALREAMRQVRENPVDASKPYATPWRPRPYMSAFAFIPRYLEVNHNICSAVYLRHPVARPGLAEVPTPFDTQMSQLAFTWYLRRR
jgi:ribosomal protein S4